MKFLGPSPVFQELISLLFSSFVMTLLYDSITVRPRTPSEFRVGSSSESKLDPLRPCITTVLGSTSVVSFPTKPSYHCQ